jgi:predicted metal-dependent HD superfamily phosphohydrolase
MEIILLTKDHLDKAGQVDQISQLFLDLDMQILASQPETYQVYTQNVRKEYSHFSDEDFMKGRGKFLLGIKGKQIFYDDRFLALNEVAQENIGNEIEALGVQDNEDL